MPQSPTISLPFFLLFSIIGGPGTCAVPAESDPSAVEAQAKAPAVEPAVGKEDQAVVQIAQYPVAPFEDRRGRQGFASVLQSVIRSDGERFVHFTTEDGLPSKMVRGILVDEQRMMWFATAGGA